MYKQLIYIAFFTTSLAGCSKDEPPSLIPTKELNLVQEQLNAAAERAVVARERYAQVEIQQNPIKDTQSPDYLPEALAERLDIRFHGPIEALMNGVAKRMDYELRVLGPRPASDVLVRVNGDHRRVFDLLRDVGLQVGARGTVRIDPDQNVLELVYAQK